MSRCGGRCSACELVCTHQTVCVRRMWRAVAHAGRGGRARVTSRATSPPARSMGGAHAHAHAHAMGCDCEGGPQCVRDLTHTHEHCYLVRLLIVHVDLIAHLRAVSRTQDGDVGRRHGVVGWPAVPGVWWWAGHEARPQLRSHVALWSRAVVCDALAARSWRVCCRGQAAARRGHVGGSDAAGGAAVVGGAQRCAGAEGRGSSVQARTLADSTHSIPYRFVSTCPRPR
eukprot:1509530-Prymnesium_polylepis.1